MKINFIYLSQIFCYVKLNLIFGLASGCSVARLSRLLWEQEAAGSNPATPTTNPFYLCKKDFFVKAKSSLLEIWL